LIAGARYNSGMWIRSSWRGVTAHKLPEDMWNYQEIISDMSPSIILEVVHPPLPPHPSS
jgi:cephalosporin hydroxylase